MSEQTVTIIGSYISPYVRKVLVCLDLKNVPYRIDPIIPYFGNETFSQMSPLRRIPVLSDGQVTLCDSTVICEYLDEVYAGPPLLPDDPAKRASARWLEEYADTRMGEIFIWRLFNQRVINRYVWGETPDEALLQKVLERDIPDILDYLEGQVAGPTYLFADICLADIAVASFFRNAAFAGFTVDSERWPRTAAFVVHVLAHPAFHKLHPFEELQLRTPIPRQREALSAAGAPLTDRSLAAAKPRRGVVFT
jgi:glutathione S-transferase